MFKKFESPFWYSYIQWPNVIDAINNCTIPADSASRWGGRDKRCWDQLDCALTAADASQQQQYSSAATILGLLPTVLSMMATSSEELLQIHHRYPLLAFFLALCNPSTILSNVRSKHRLNPERLRHARAMLNSKRSPDYYTMIDRFLTIRIPGSQKPLKMTDFIYDLILHTAAALLAAVMVWQAMLLGIRGVIVFACWTWHEPFTWVGVGGLAHLLYALAWRLCLGPISPSEPWSRWHWSLSRSGGNLLLAHPRIARFFDLVFQVIGLMNYGYGTVMLSGTSLVSPANSLMVFCLMGFASMSSRLLAIWLVEVWPEVPVEDSGIAMGALKEDDGQSADKLLGARSREVPEI